MLEIGNGGMTDDEYRTHMSLWSMLAAPLLAGNDVRSMTDATKAILMNKEVIAIDQDSLGAPAQLAKTDGDVEIWIRPLQGSATGLAFFNKGDQPAQAKLSWSEVKLKKPKKARDLWSHKDVKLSSDGYSAKVPAHGTVLLKVL